MRVSELIAELQKLPQDALVGTAATFAHGWIQVASGICVADTHEGFVVAIDSEPENFLNPDDNEAEPDTRAIYRSEERIP